jgi:hypothetical protein
MQVEEVHFNHDTGGATADALTIRKGPGGSPIQAPEWRRGFTPEPAAYASTPLGPTVTIKARFSGGPPNGTRRIRALDAYVEPSGPGGCGCLGWLVLLIVKLIRAIFGNVLGDAEAKTVAFDANGLSGLETFTLIYHKLKTASVGIRTTDWKWQERKTHAKKSKWTTFDTTQHRIYTVLDMPVAPWTQGGGNDTQLPWTDALDKACAWAAGTTTKDAAAAAITRSVNTQPTQSYTPSTLFGFSTYHLSSYLGQLNGGAPFQLNCTDCADAVTTLSNLLGCDLWEGRFFNMVTRKFLTLNGNPAVEADWVSWSWGYHEICWLGAIGQFASVYDGCLQLDMDDNYGDLVHVAQHPIKMTFGTTDPAHYKYRLIDSGLGDLENVPRRRQLD